MTATEFQLSEDVRFSVIGNVPELQVARWQDPGHLPQTRRCLVLVAGETLWFDQALAIDRHSVLELELGAALPELSPDGLEARLLARCLGPGADAITKTLLALPLSNSSDDGGMRRLRLELRGLTPGEWQFGLACDPGPENDPRADWLAIADFCIGPVDRIDLVRARGFHPLRAENERAAFSTVYQHPIYRREGEARRREIEVEDLAELGWSLRSGGLRDGSADPAPLAGENALAYAERLLSHRLGLAAPDFPQRLQTLASRGPVKALSLLSGSARVEAELAAHVGSAVDWTLIDLNPDLLRQAAQVFPSDVRMRLLAGDLNGIEAFGRYDVVVCVSALHHVVELEALMAAIARSLEPEGELWVIGEYIGRNGNRLWPDAAAVAEPFFRSLPARLRLNRMTGRTDDELADIDASIGCFEGIRAETVEPALDRHFRPIQRLRRNCLLWRMVDLAYLDNWDLSRPEDLALLRKAVDLEVHHFQAGGRPTELHGVYRLDSPG